MRVARIEAPHSVGPPQHIAIHVVHLECRPHTCCLMSGSAFAVLRFHTMHNVARSLHRVYQPGAPCLAWGELFRRAAYPGAAGLDAGRKLRPSLVMLDA